ncbi:NUDIX hydrolase [Catenovulum adriaticum]|uniref:NUDIX domain-containing protein n=1 Tax=Catenovulum adriaticum TaxID=2984846 RepID=A0ABY7ATP6_9ALTE|nr:NUDIX domain-containing protein [Catenovulum sp. TS8]WAJ71890.1 NUDIX domain-containing protein [Catenovulum sp. TS8]
MSTGLKDGAELNTSFEHLQEEFLPADCMNNVTVDNLILAMQEGKLKVLLAKYKHGLAANQWGLIGHWVRNDEDLEAAANRVVTHTTGVKNFHLEQLAAFGNVNRYPLRRIITVAFFALVRFEEANVVHSNSTLEVDWFDIKKLPSLVFDHGSIVDSCLQHLKYKVRHEPVGFSLLPEKFTLLQLQEIYEAILDIKLDKPNFRRKIQKMNLLINCKEKQKDVAHRAATLYRFDINVYEKLKEFGFNFEY